MPSIDQLLSRVVERKGFVVQGADQEALFARKGEESLLAAWKLDGPLTAADAQLFLSALDQVHATTGILVAPRGVDPSVKEAIGARAVELWAEARLVHEVGEAFVHDALDAAHPAATPARLPSSPPAQAPAAAPARPASKFPSLIAQAAGATSAGTSNPGAAMYMSSKPKGVAPADMQATIPQKGGSLGYAWGGAVGATSSPGIAQIRSGRNPKRGLQEGGTVTGAAPAAPSYMVAPDDVEVTSSRRGARPATPAAETSAPRASAPAETEAYEIITTKKAPAAQAKISGPATSGCLKVNLTKEEAIAKANAKPTSTVKLALVPHVTFEYDLHMERPGMPAPIEAKGALLINSLTGELRSVDALAYADAFPSDARKDQEKLQAVDVYDKVKSHMAKAFGRTMNVEREVAGNVVSSTLKIVPDPEEMGLEHKGIQYVPVWEITTSTGVSKVDAYAGQVLG